MNVLRRRAVLATVALAAAVSGCGKSLPQHTTASAKSSPALIQTGAVGISTKNTTRLGGLNPILDAASVARVIYPGSTPSTRPGAVVLVNADDWPAALAASSLASAPLSAPLLYSEGNSLPEASAQTLAAIDPSGASQLSGAQVLEVATSALATKKYRVRVLASSREPASEAVAVEQQLSAVQGSAPHQVIVVASNAPQAMAMPAAGLAAQSGAPILFVNTTSVPQATSTLLKTLDHPSIYAIGPTQVISEAVISELGKLGTVKRINGSGPATNAIAVAQFLEGGFGWGVQEPGHGLVFANASRPLDAPAAAPLSANGDYGPLLLLESARALPAELSTFLSNIQPGYTEEPQCRPVRGVYNHGWLIGEEAAISTTTQAEIDTLLEISSRKSCTAPPVTP